MAELHSTHVDPDIFKDLQDKIDEEGKVRDVLRLAISDVHATETDIFCRSSKKLSRTLRSRASDALIVPDWKIS
jgi:hypothetical protein